MAYSAKAVANVLLALGVRDRIDIDPMKLQKLLYYCHGWHLAIEGTALLDETVEAWKYGPVVGSIYREFAEFGNQPITRKATRVNCEDGNAIVVAPRIPLADVQTRAMIDRVWGVYKGYTGGQLSNSTHVPGGPWDQTVSRYGGNPPKGKDIDDEVIRRWFAERALTHDKRAAANG